MRRLSRWKSAKTLAAGGMPLMPHSLSTSENFLLAMAIIFTVPWLVWRLVRADHVIE